MTVATLFHIILHQHIHNKAKFLELKRKLVPTDPSAKSF